MTSKINTCWRHRLPAPTQSPGGGGTGGPGALLPPPPASGLSSASVGSGQWAEGQGWEHSALGRGGRISWQPRDGPAALTACVRAHRVCPASRSGFPGGVGRAPPAGLPGPRNRLNGVSRRGQGACRLNRTPVRRALCPRAPGPSLHCRQGAPSTGLSRHLTSDPI